jgi:MipA family protein
MKKKYVGFIVCSLLGSSLFCFAGDLSNDVRNGTNKPNSVDGSYVEIGMGVLAATSPFYGIPENNKNGKILTSGTLDVNLRLQYKGWFVEGFSHSLENLTFGYNLANNNNWSFDVVALQQHGEFDDDESRDLKELKRRESDAMGGLRMTGYLDRYIVQFHMLSDISEVHNGQVYSAKVARNWQNKNWNYHLILGASYRTEKVADYYLSVDTNYATEKFPRYDAHAGFTGVIEIGATYPISQKWVFRTLLRHIELDHNWSGSPLLLSTGGSAFLTSVNYVF